LLGGNKVKKKGTIFIILLFIITSITGCSSNDTKTMTPFTILSSSENKDVEPMLIDYAKKNNINLTIEYAGTIDMMEILNEDNQKYDAIWCSNSIWLYMLENQSMIKNSKFISINPVVFGITKSKAIELGFVDNDTIYMKEIIEKINSENLSLIMPSVTQTNSGASMYLSIVASLSNQAETNSFMPSNEDLINPEFQEALKELFSRVSRTSGDEVYALELYKNDPDQYDAVINYESNILMLNNELVANGEEPLYLVYPYDGVSLSDSPFAYIDHGNEETKETFQLIQSYLLSDDVQSYLLSTGRRVSYGGNIAETDSSLFKSEWGVKTDVYLTTNHYPSADIIKVALSIYQNTLKKPSHIVFCLDYSGSMYGDGYSQLVEAMQYILDYNSASNSFIQFSKQDKITIILFSNSIISTLDSVNGLETERLVNEITLRSPSGGTNIYLPTKNALSILNAEDSDIYNLSIVLMTDGHSNAGEFKDVETYYSSINKEIPVYSIMFGKASNKQLNELAKLTNGKVFDGTQNLIRAFKEIRGYN